MRVVSKRDREVLQSANVRRRLRKKRFLGEFTVYGFELAFGLSAELTQDQRNALLDRFIVDAIEAGDDE